jgi:hypothetical protein
MNLTGDTMHDPLDELLAPPPVPPPQPEVFDRTVQVLRRQRRVRRLGGIGVLMAVYAAGLLTILACQPPQELSSGQPRLSREEAQTAMLPSTPLPRPGQMASELEWKALTAPDEAAGLYRQAGDLYLADSEPAEAVRCYGNALAAGKTQDLEVSPEDSWLLMVIKQARKKERDECDK